MKNFEQGREVARYIRAEMRELDDGRVVGWSPAADHLRAPNGTIHAGALLTVLDYIGGVCGGLASLPDGWVVAQDHPKRGLVVHPAPDAGPEEVLEWLLRVGDAVCRLPLTGRWVAAVYG